MLSALWNKLGGHAALQRLGLADSASLQKAASIVNTGLDQYKRLIDEFNNANKAWLKGYTIPTEGLALHGTSHPASLKTILESGQIPSMRQGPRAVHGHGVYWWRGLPDYKASWLTTPHSEGIATPFATLPHKEGDQSHVYVSELQDKHLFAPREQRTSQYRLRPGDLAVINTTDPESHYLHGLIQDHGMEAVDSQIFDQARRDFLRRQLAHLPEHLRSVRGRPATEAEVSALYERRMQAPKEPGLRPEYTPPEVMGAEIKPTEVKPLLSEEERAILAEEEGAPVDIEGNVIPPHLRIYEKNKKKKKLPAAG